MFEGSNTTTRGTSTIQQDGGLLNGSTNPDRTNYWEVMPTGALEWRCGWNPIGWDFSCRPHQGEVRKPRDVSSTNAVKITETGPTD